MNPIPVRVAIYARVSSNRQEREQTVESQLAELRAEVTAAGHADFEQYVDEGYSRSDLARPRLDCLRDAIKDGEIQKIFVHAPDRLASGIHLMILYEEFTGRGAEVVFLNGDVEDTPEGRLLLQMQGAIGDFERAKTAERTRRGKLYWARQGNIPVGVRAYGYEMIKRVDGSRATLRVNDGQAAIIRLIFRLLVDDHMSLRGIANELSNRKIPTPRGAVRWRPTTLRNMIRNRIYYGELLYRQSGMKRRRGLEPNDPTVISIPVEAILDVETWSEAQKQLDRNFDDSSRNNKVNFYLLRGLICCQRCGGRFSGQAKNGVRRYRCVNFDYATAGKAGRCKSRSFSAVAVEEAVWTAVFNMLKRPDLILSEMERRWQDTQSREVAKPEIKRMKLAIRLIKKQRDRITDAYVAELIEMDDFRSRMDALSAEKTEMEAQLAALLQSEHSAAELEKTVEEFEDFASTVHSGMEHLTGEERRDLLRLLVEEVMVENGVVTINTVVPPPPKGDSGSLRTHHAELDSGSPRNPWSAGSTPDSGSDSQHEPRASTRQRINSGAEYTLSPTRIRGYKSFQPHHFSYSRRKRCQSSVT